MKNKLLTLKNEIRQKYKTLLPAVPRAQRCKESDHNSDSYLQEENSTDIIAMKQAKQVCA